MDAVLWGTARGGHWTRCQEEPRNKKLAWERQPQWCLRQGGHGVRAGLASVLFLRHTSLQAARPSQAVVLAWPLVSKVPCLAGNTLPQEPLLPTALCLKPEGLTTTGTPTCGRACLDGAHAHQTCSWRLPCAPRHSRLQLR